MFHSRISVTRRRERKGSRKPNRKPPLGGGAELQKKGGALLDLVYYLIAQKNKRSATHYD